MLTSRKLVTIISEARNCNSTKPPIKEFVEFLQGPLEYLYSAVNDVLNTPLNPVHIKLKIVGPPIVSNRSFSGLCIIGKDAFDRKTIELRIRQKDTQFNWKCLLVLSSEKIADIILGISRISVKKYLDQAETESIFFENSSASKTYEIVNANAKTLNKVKICENLTSKIFEPANLREFCYGLILPKDNSKDPKKLLTEIEIFLAIERYTNERHALKILKAILCNMVLKGLFEPIPDKQDDYQNVKFMPSIMFYESADGYLTELEKEKNAKIEQQRLVLQNSLARAQGELERLESQIEQKKLDIKKIQKEIEQFNLEP